MKTAKNNTTQYVLRTASLYVVIVAPSPLLWYYFTDRHTTFNCNKKLLHVEYLLNVLLNLCLAATVHEKDNCR